MPQMFIWSADCLKNYASGTIAAVGEDVEAARVAVRAAFEDHLREEKEWLFGPLQDEDDLAEIDSYKAQMEEDIAQEPVIRTVLFIRGSE